MGYHEEIELLVEMNEGDRAKGVVVHGNRGNRGTFDGSGLGGPVCPSPFEEMFGSRSTCWSREWRLRGLEARQ